MVIRCEYNTRLVSCHGTSLVAIVDRGKNMGQNLLILKIL
nr:MAG TPA: hypothetical protein [Caudoviricetes sp.]